MGKIKNLNYSVDAREKIKKGVDKLADAVRSTLGPCGRNVLIQRENGTSFSTKDGVSVAKEIHLKDPVENMGAQVIKEVSMKAAKHAGDGTTTATVLAATVYAEGLKYITAGANPIELKRGMDKAVTAVVDNLRKISKDVSTNEEIKQVATISANNDSSIGTIIAEAMESVGKNGIIEVEQSKTFETTLEIVEGMKIDRGYVSPYFVTDNASMSTTLESPYILICDKRIGSVKEILPLLETCSKQNKSLLIIADDVDGEALATLVVNKARGILNICAIKAPGYGDRKLQNLEDIAILTGGQVVSTQKGHKLDRLAIEMLGTARTVKITKEDTIIVDGAGESEAIKDRIQNLKDQYDEADGEYEKQAIKERISKLVGGVAVLNIGAASEVELREKVDRVDDALHATRAAVEEGIVIGGGMALYNASLNLEFGPDALENDDQRLGVQIIKKACKAPFEAIVSNAGKNPEAILACMSIELNLENIGYDARNDMFVDMTAAGIIDPTKVTRTALELASSVAGTLLTTECVVSIEPDKEKEQAGVPDYSGQY